MRKRLGSKRSRVCVSNRARPARPRPRSSVAWPSGEDRSRRNKNFSDLFFVIFVFFVVKAVDERQDT